MKMVLREHPVNYNTEVTKKLSALHGKGLPRVSLRMTDPDYDSRVELGTVVLPWKCPLCGATRDTVDEVLGITWYVGFSLDNINKSLSEGNFAPNCRCSRPRCAIGAAYQRKYRLTKRAAGL